MSDFQADLNRSEEQLIMEFKDLINEISRKVIASTVIVELKEIQKQMENNVHDFRETNTSIKNNIDQTLGGLPKKIDDSIEISVELFFDKVNKSIIALDESENRFGKSIAKMRDEISYIPKVIEGAASNEIKNGLKDIDRYSKEFCDHLLSLRTINVAFDELINDLPKLVTDKVKDEIAKRVEEIDLSAEELKKVSNNFSQVQSQLYSTASELSKVVVEIVGDEIRKPMQELSGYIKELDVQKEKISESHDNLVQILAKTTSFYNDLWSNQKEVLSDLSKELLKFRKYQDEIKSEIKMGYQSIQNQLQANQKHMQLMKQEILAEIKRNRY